MWAKNQGGTDWALREHSVSDRNAFGSDPSVLQKGGLNLRYSTLVSTKVLGTAGCSTADIERSTLAKYVCLCCL